MAMELDKTHCSCKSRGVVSRFTTVLSGTKPSTSSSPDTKRMQMFGSIHSMTTVTIMTRDQKGHVSSSTHEA